MRIVEALCFFGFALLLRLWRYPVVFTPEGVRFFGNDAYYHARRIQYGVERFPEMLFFDPYVAFPQGGEPIWPLLLDRLLAALAWLFIGPGREDAVAAMIVWMPPLVGALSVLLLWAFARRGFGASAARIAAFTLALMPAHAHYSQLGFVDHHAVVVLATIAVAWASWRAVDEPQSRKGVVACTLGALFAFSFAVWPGALVYVLVAEAALFVALALEEDAERARRRARLTLGVQGVAFALIGPMALGQQWQRWGSVSPLVLSNFQPLLFGLLGVGAAAAWAMAERGAARIPRTAAALVAVIAAAGLCAFAFPQLLCGAQDAWLWLSRSESFQAVVAESSPLLRAPSGAWDLGRAVGSLSLLFFAAPALGLALVWRGGEGRALRWVLAGWLLTAFALALLQRRFAGDLAAPLALAFAWAVRELFESLRWRHAGRFAAVAVTAGVAALLLPVLTVHAKRAASLVPWLTGTPYELRDGHRQRHLLHELGLWLRENTAPTRGFFDASLAPEYGVLAAWGDGHVLRYAARRPTVTDNFGDDVGTEGMQAADAYFAATDEQEASRILDALGVRYVVVRSTGSGVRPLGDPRSMLARLYWGNGEGLVRHRLIQASLEHIASEPPRPVYRIWEHVPGALLTGAAPEGAEVKASIAVREPSGAVFVYEAHARANAAGQYELRLPYATAASGDAVDTATDYALEIDGVPASEGLVVREAELY